MNERFAPEPGKSQIYGLPSQGASGHPRPLRLPCQYCSGVYGPGRVVFFGYYRGITSAPPPTCAGATGTVPTNDSRIHLPVLRSLTDSNHLFFSNKRTLFRTCRVYDRFSANMRMAIRRPHGDASSIRRIFPDHDPLS